MLSKRKYLTVKEIRNQKATNKARKVRSKMVTKSLDHAQHTEGWAKRSARYEAAQTRRLQPDPLNPPEMDFRDYESNKSGSKAVRRTGKLLGYEGSKTKHQKRLKRLKIQNLRRKIAPLPGKLGQSGKINPRVGGLMAVGAMVAEAAGSKAYGAVKTRVKKNLQKRHVTAIKKQDKRLAKRYKKSDPKKQARFDRLMSRELKMKNKP